MADSDNGSIFIRLAVVGSLICEIPPNSEKIRTCDTFIRPRQKHKQHNSTIYKKYEKKLDQD